MQIFSTFLRWLSSFLISLVVSCVVFACVAIAYEALDLQQRLGLDDDVCWLALLLGPALIVVIHRGFHRQAWVSAVTLAGGLALAGVGVFYFLSAREAEAHHVPAGPLSGMEYAIGMLIGLFIIVIASLAVLGAILALAARRIGRVSQ